MKGFFQKILNKTQKILFIDTTQIKIRYIKPSTMDFLVKTETDQNKVKEDFKSFILENNHPCVMAKSLFKMNHYHLKIYSDMNDEASLIRLINDIEEYIKQYNFDDTSFESFIAVFPNEQFGDEISFEKALWRTLQKLHDLDATPWDHRVSDHKENAEFSFSLAGRAFYMVGMHPESSRLSRRAPYPSLVFNLHHQFEKLRTMGTFTTVRDTIRKNDAQLQGDINPVLRDFGADSETKQYSGRQVEQNWKCPFHK